MVSSWGTEAHSSLTLTSLKRVSSNPTVVDPENWTGALALESPWWGGIQHGTDQEGSRGGVQGQGCPGIGAR